MIELMVTISIFVFMTALVLARYNSYNSGILLTNTAYDIALVIRQAQTYGVSVMTTSASSPNFSYPYGVEFRMNTSYFPLFIDTNSDGVYDVVGDGSVTTYHLQQNALISNICIGNGSSCDSSSAGTVDITFKRPDPSAIIIAPNLNKTTTYNFVRLTIISGDKTSCRNIIVRQSGQISVESDTTCYTGSTSSTTY